MKSVDYYRGREQTYLKHFFLENYLERVAYNIFSFLDDFVFIDGFSGPWRSEDELYEDTSFAIAISKLRQIQKGFADQGRSPRIRFLFVENNPQRFTELRNATESFGRGIDATPIRGSFEELKRFAFNLRHTLQP